MDKRNPILTIGMPVYNGANYLEAAILSIINQSVINFILLISDNASTDNTEDIARKYAETDSRVKYFRQNENIGAINNFKFVSSEVKTPYFMWFAADDILESTFVEVCINHLEENQNIGMAFTGITNIDSLGRVIRHYEHLPNFSGTANCYTVLKYLLSPEVFGKANLIYSIYRTSIITDVLERAGMSAAWGGDMSFVLAAILKSGVYVSDRVLFRKRWVREKDDTALPLNVEIAQGLLNQSCPIECFPEYENATIDAARGTRFLFLTAFIMRYRYFRLLGLRRDQERNYMREPTYLVFGQYLKNLCSSFVFAFKVLLGNTN